MERHVLESLLTGDDEASVIARAALRRGAPYSVEERVQATGAHAGVFLTEDGSALVACASWPLPLVARKPRLEESGGGAAPHLRGCRDS